MKQKTREEFEEIKDSLLLKWTKFADELMSSLEGSFESKLKITRILLAKEKINHPILEHKFTKNICKLRFEIFKRDDFKCVYCGRMAKDGAELRVDHVNPRSKGGTNHPENLVTACHECNMGKYDALLTERSLRKVMSGDINGLSEKS